MNSLSNALAGWLIVVAAFDLASRRVPNWVVGIGLVAGLFALATGLQPFLIPPASALLASLVIFGIFLIFYATGLMGGGDVKFAAVLGLWFGHALLMQVFVLGTLFACLHAVVVLLRHSPSLILLWPRMIKPVVNVGNKNFFKNRKTPYAAYLAIGALMTFV